MPRPITFDNIGSLERALQRAARAHHDYEVTSGVKDENWPAWYAEYISEEQAIRDGLLGGRS